MRTCVLCNHPVLVPIVINDKVLCAICTGKAFPRSRKRTAKSLLAKMKRKIAGSDSDPCVYCGGRATTVDHIIPMGNGGSRKDLQNLAPCCYKCNHGKSNLSILLHLLSPKTKRRIRSVQKSSIK